MPWHSEIWFACHNIGNSKVASHNKTTCLLKQGCLNRDFLVFTPFYSMITRKRKDQLKVGDGLIACILFTSCLKEIQNKENKIFSGMICVSATDLPIC